MKKEREKYLEPNFNIVCLRVEDVVKCSGLNVITPTPDSGTGGEIDYGDFEWSNWF